MKLLTALGLSTALLLSAQPAAALNAPTLRTKSVCLAVLRKANAAHHPPVLRRCNLRGANLRRADLRGGYLQDANLRGANLRGANLRGATMPDGSIHP